MEISSQYESRITEIKDGNERDDENSGSKYPLYK